MMEMRSAVPPPIPLPPPRSEKDLDEVLQTTSVFINVGKVGRAGTAGAATCGGWVGRLRFCPEGVGGGRWGGGRAEIALHQQPPVQG